jgi:hypothetical protein
VEKICHRGISEVMSRSNQTCALPGANPKGRKSIEENTGSSTSKRQGPRQIIAVKSKIHQMRNEDFETEEQTRMRTGRKVKNHSCCSR